MNTAGISTRVHRTLQLRTGKLLLYFFKKHTKKKEWSLPELCPILEDYKPIQGLLSHGLNVSFPEQRHPEQ